MATENIAGKDVDIGPDGHMTDSKQWTKEVAVELAKREGILSLTDAHWKILDFLQTRYKADSCLPSIRALKNSGVVPVKDLYELFPVGPLKKAAKIAGLPKPASCV
jgi:tRNA 2-thiouridine synthesizing protein E